MIGRGVLTTRRRRLRQGDAGKLSLVLLAYHGIGRNAIPGVSQLLRRKAMIGFNPPLAFSPSLSTASLNKKKTKPPAVMLLRVVAYGDIEYDFVNKCTGGGLQQIRHPFETQVKIRPAN